MIQNMLPIYHLYIAGISGALLRPIPGALLRPVLACPGVQRLGAGDDRKAAGMAAQAQRVPCTRYFRLILSSRVRVLK